MKSDIVSVVYKELFSIKFLHSGYGTAHQNSISDSIMFLPDEQTKIVIKNHHLSYGLFDDRLVCFIRSQPINPPTKEPKQPFILFSGEIRMRFLMLAANDFINKTNITSAGAAQTYQFSNRLNIGTGGFIARNEEGVNDDDLSDSDTLELNKSCLGVIDIYNSGAINTSYNLFGAGQQLLSPRYNLRFISNI